MKLNEKELRYWNRYLDTVNTELSSSHVEAGIAGNDEIADELLNLYLNGEKTAGSGLAIDYKLSNEDFPSIGDHWIILDTKKEPRCIVKTIRVEFYQFDEIPEEVAIAEGEGDLSLDYWRKAHIEFFTPYLKDWNVDDLNKEQVVTEFFEVVYK